MESRFVSVPKVGWFVNSRIDTLLILVLGPLISLLLLGSIEIGVGFVVLAMLFAVLLDFPHVLHTYLRLLSSPADFLAHQRHFWLGLFAIGLACTAIAITGNLVWLVSVWVYWQPYHVLKQHFGVATLYARKQGYRAGTEHVKYLVMTGFAAPIVHRIQAGGFQFGHYEIFGYVLPFSGMTLYTPPLPDWSALLAYAVFVVAAAAFVRREWGDRRDGASLPRRVWVMLAVVLAIYNAAYLMVSDLYALILISTSIHALQYHLICAVTIRRTPPALSDAQRAKLPAWLVFAERHALKITATPLRWGLSLVLAGLVVLAFEHPTLGVVPLVIVLHHFYLDGVIWRRR